MTTTNAPDSNVVVVCPRCGAKNRIDLGRAAAGRPVCARCKTPLDVNAAAAPSAGRGGKPVDVTDGSFERDVIATSNDRPVLVDCWAPWCGPCRMVAPTIDALAAESGGRYAVAKLNTDENPQTAGRYGINSIPTLLIFRNGQVVDRLVGVQPKSAITQRLVRA
jgi:thioredoxin